MEQTRNLLQFLALSLILTLGIYVRFVDLGTHFTTIDDIGVACDILKAKMPLNIDEVRIKINDKNKMTYFSIKKILFRELDRRGLLEPMLKRGDRLRPFVTIPFAWTYAPLQFFITPLLISPEQSYREVLFWGRFPPFVFGVLGLFLIILFYKKFYKENYFAYTLIALTLLAFSWENISYAKHMSSYSMGVFSALLLVIFLWLDLNNPDLSFKRFLLMSVPVALLSYTQYQILFFVPAYYATLYFFYLKQTKNKLLLLKNFIFSYLAYIIFISPLFLFLHGLQNRGVTSITIGPSREFLLDLSSVHSVIDKIMFATFFYIKNSIMVMQFVLSIILKGHALFIPINALFIFLFICGIVSFIKTKNKQKKYLGLFFLLSTLVWFFLVFQKKLTLTPTRHSLILLPFIVIMISEGIGYIAMKISYVRNEYVLHVLISSVMSIALIVLFFLGFNSIVKARQDPFSEYEIEKIVSRYNVDTIISNDSASYNMKLIIKSLPKCNYYVNSGLYEPGFWYRNNKHTLYQTIAYVSRDNKIDAYIFDEIKKNINKDMQSLDSFYFNLSDYDVIYSKEITTDIEVDLNPIAKHNPNGLYFYILRKKAI